MIIMNVKTAVFSILMCAALTGRTHNPQLATFFIRNLEGVWVIEGSFPQHGLHEALREAYENIQIDSLGPPEYKNLLIDYIKGHILIETEDNREIVLGEGGLRLGNHQTDVRFVLENLPESPQDLKVKIGCLQENDHHTNILRVPALGNEQFILNEDNSFTAELITTAGAPAMIGISLIFFWGVIIMVLTGGIVWIFGVKKKLLASTRY